METTAPLTVPAATSNVHRAVTGSAYTEATSGMMVVAPMVAGSTTRREGAAAPAGVATARPSTVALLDVCRSTFTVAAAPLTSRSPRPAPQGAVLPATPPSPAVRVTGFSPACPATCDVRAATGTSGYMVASRIATRQDAHAAPRHSRARSSGARAYDIGQPGKTSE